MFMDHRGWQRPSTTFVSLLLVVGAASPAAGQSMTTVDTETISVEDVGDYRPEHKANQDEVARQIVERTNAFRGQKDLGTLRVEERLRETAADFADYMARTGRYGHQADDRTAAERVAAHGYEYCIVAENIAYQFDTRGLKTPRLAKQLFIGWRESPEHRRNLLNDSVTETGVAVRQSDETGVYFAVHLFGRPRSARFAFEIVNRSEQTLEYRLGEKGFALPPRYTRRHEICTQRGLEVLRDDQAVQELAVEPDVTYEVAETDEGLRLKPVAADNDADKQSK